MLEVNESTKSENAHLSVVEAKEAVDIFEPLGYEVVSDRLSVVWKAQILQSVEEKRGAVFLEADAMERADAEQAVKCLLYLYRAGMLAPLPFFPKASYQLFQTGSMADAENVWEGEWGSSGDAGRFGMFFGGKMPTGALVESLAKAFFGAAVFTGGKGGKA